VIEEEENANAWSDFYEISEVAYYKALYDALVACGLSVSLSLPDPSNCYSGVYIYPSTVVEVVGDDEPASRIATFGRRGNSYRIELRPQIRILGNVTGNCFTTRAQLEVVATTEKVRACFYNGAIPCKVLIPTVTYENFTVSGRDVRSALLDVRIIVRE
jgi:hypothetical protein